MARSTAFYRWNAAGRRFSSVSSTNKDDRHDIAEILLKVALSTINLHQANPYLWIWRKFEVISLRSDFRRIVLLCRFATHSRTFLRKSRYARSIKEKSKYWLARNQNNVSETCLLPTQHVGLVQGGPHHHLLENQPVLVVI